jgi:hypothetical protein
LPLLCDETQQILEVRLAGFFEQDGSPGGLHDESLTVQYFLVIALKWGCSVFDSGVRQKIPSLTLRSQCHWHFVEKKSS